MLDTQIPIYGLDFINTLKSILTKTINIFSNILKVKSTNNLLKLSECNEGITISNQVKTKGVIADLIIIPFMDTLETSMVEAYAYPCAFDASTNRPILGAIGFTNLTSFKKINFENYYVYLALHELTHVLVFYDEIFKTFIDFKDLDDPTVGF